MKLKPVDLVKNNNASDSVKKIDLDEKRKHELSLGVFAYAKDHPEINVGSAATLS